MNKIYSTILVAVCYLLAFPVSAEENEVYTEKQASLSAEYNMEFKNLSSSQYKLKIDKESSKCMYDSGPNELNIGPDEKSDIYLKDNDNIFSGCTLRVKSVSWKVSSGPVSCDLTFEHGYDAGWYTEIKGCENIVERAVCGETDCYEIKAYGGEPKIDISVEFLAE
ncbi:hypothetical protein FE392_10805 [Xenorhabdus sp. 12]|uniref:Uncharacterized protein n=1 Tax=Xenorhabdus santafensis TaxID=2582833 RepID=A0ABU4SAM3_9GAMM|nr:hypothetical protein [Xenorhabdus sp. 12]MDX7987815.1 hypothetical protein [Xenorhabdus sp. 12]